jgi:apolipoprotein D and lipocalin family protein
MQRFIFLFFIFSLLGCTGIPEGVKPVSNFDITKYQGKWYEIARLDHSFERGLENITAQYNIKENGDVEVINRGFSIEDKEWEDANGVASFVESSDLGYLKVSFFRPFYGSYIIFDLDENYQYAFVSGPDKSYLWFLSRTPTPPKEIVEKFKNSSKELGFNVNELIFPSHDEVGVTK